MAKFLRAGAMGVVLALTLPVFAIFIELFYVLGQNFLQQDFATLSTIKENLNHFFDFLLLKFLKDTFIVSFFVVFMSVFLGVSTAYLMANFHLYQGPILEKILILPLAIPAYILAFVYVGIMEFDGFFHECFGFKINFFNAYGVIFVLSLSLYPYVYLFAKTAFQTEAREVFELAKIARYSEWKFFCRFAFIIAKPAILASAMLVLMETLSDYGASAYLGADTFSAGIFKLWYDLNDPYSSSVLCAFLMGFVFILMLAEQLYKRRQKSSFNQDLKTILAKRPLSPWAKIFASFYCFGVSFLGFILPFFWLLYWGLRDEKLWQSDFYILAAKSLILASSSAFMIVIIACFLNFVARISSKNFSLWILKLSSLGYAIPGAAIGISVMIASIFLGRFIDARFLWESFLVLIFAYIVRFLATAIYSFESAYSKIHHQLDTMSLHLRPSYFVLFFKLHFPLLKHYFILAFIVVFIDCIKELPLSRILSPFGFETLSVKAFWYANDERIYDAALPSLLIVVLSLLSLMLVMRRGDAAH
ncbi:iron ABC transporter permease [Campylobacter sp.]|uniref:ABC transporter permease n=1 Tax=Campylobacter sp. TaxID=205 RepID=UPI0026DBC7DB|nr:iron ABC transporter permease [Campylobacter sp.]MDO4674567.1 iron ABC transporter permease [Campylobacter sp.]